MDNSRWRTAIGSAAILFCVCTPTIVGAQDFFSSLFGSFVSEPRIPRPAGPSMPLPYGNDQEESAPPVTRRFVRPPSAGSSAYCVRTCDGRYFPLTQSARENESGAICKSFCPAANTEIFYGDSIESASTENGKSYFELPNAYRYREKLVEGCTCNGKDPTGLAAIRIEDDRTLRKGDIVVGENRQTVVIGRSEKQGAMNFRPPPSLAAKSRRQPTAAIENSGD
jgi:hypothetical protein